LETPVEIPVGFETYPPEMIVPEGLPLAVMPSVFPVEVAFEEEPAVEVVNTFLVEVEPDLTPVAVLFFPPDTVFAVVVPALDVPASADDVCLTGGAVVEMTVLLEAEDEAVDKHWDGSAPVKNVETAVGPTDNLAKSRSPTALA
jgi:hypothetical protein